MIDALAAAGYLWAFSSLSSPGARAHYDRRREAGERHTAAQRMVMDLTPDGDQVSGVYVVTNPTKLTHVRPDDTRNAPDEDTAGPPRDLPTGRVHLYADNTGQGLQRRRATSPGTCAPSKSSSTGTRSPPAPAASGEPWQYFDLGHGWCTYAFFEQCRHRMACARCDFYTPKESSKGQLLEAKETLQKMLASIPLTDDERAAVDDGKAALDQLLERLTDVPTPPGRHLARSVFPPLQRCYQSSTSDTRQAEGATALLFLAAGRRLVEEFQFIPFRGFEVFGVLFEHLAGDQGCSPDAACAAGFDPFAQLIERGREVVQLDRNAERTCRQTLFVALLATPEAELQDHALSEPEQVLGMTRQPPLKTVPRSLVEEVQAEVSHPLVRAQPHSGHLLREPHGQCRLPSARKPADKNQRRSRC